MFEILKSDLAGRIGILHTAHGKVETPAYVPVIHPVKQTIPSAMIREIGFDLVITNAYITRKNYADEAVKRGIHEIIKFDGSVMTDSGGYQVLEYGDIDVTPEEMADFETKIKTDIAIPLDKPTGFGLSKKQANNFVKHTLKVSKETLDSAKDDSQIWAGPIQGGEHLDLVKRSTKTLVKDGFKMLALGSPVEFMESYEYELLAGMIVAAKKEIPAGIPLHLFGAGHPLTIPLAVALGCDTFDSASYMLYAKQDRYITDDRTRHLPDMAYFSCSCKVCQSYTPAELLAQSPQERTNKIALHNLYAIKAEVDRVKESIHEGRLWEYVMKKMRAHPKLFEVTDMFAGLYKDRYFADTTPAFKKKAVLLFSKEDQFRPEIMNYHEIVRTRFFSKKRTVCITKDAQLKPEYLSPQYTALKKRFKNPELIQFCQYNPFLGIIPLEISDVFPAAHYMSVSTADPKDHTEFAKTWKKFFENNKFEEIYLDKTDSFLRPFAKLLPKGIKKVALEN